VRRGYEQHGAMYLAVNRFLPALRAFFFVGAGLSRMSAGRVIVFGGISAALWNALLMVLGYAVGNNWEALRELAERYAAATLVLIVLAVIAVAGRFLWGNRRA
jgi:membrane-associated protein